jgi:putative transcriptional regulator
MPGTGGLRKLRMSKKTDTLTDFDKQLISGMEEVVAHINGESKGGRATVVEFADAKAIREGLGMSQAVFSRAYGIPLKTLQHWEQRRHNPDRTASAYLWTIEEFPDQVREAQQRHQMQQPAEIERRPGL